MLDSTARQHTEDEKRELRRQENDLIKAIQDREGTMKDLILDLAKVIERRIELLDCTFAVSQISSWISRTLRSLECPIAHWVSEYLPDKYKNPNIHKHTKLITDLKDIVDASVEPTELIENCSNGDLETVVQYIIKAKHVNDDIGTLLNNRKDTVLREALRRGMNIVAGEKIRDQISARDYRWEMPNNPTLQEANQEVQIQGLRYEKEIHTFYQINYPQFPATEIEDALRYANSTRVMANLWTVINEKKWSGDTDFWLDRDYFLKVQSAHKSGNSTMFPTTLCAFCSRNVEDDPKDYHVSKYDKNSPTGYRCDNCGGYEIRYRNNSREQVGDKHEENERMASDIINHIPDYVDIPKHWRERYLNPAIYARKLAISKEFSIAAFGKEKQVIARKKTNNWQYMAADG